MNIKAEIERNGHFATHCNTVTTHCNTLQHTYDTWTRENTQQASCNTLQHTDENCRTAHTAPHCTTLQHFASRCNPLMNIVALQHTCNTLTIIEPERTHKLASCNTLQRRDEYCHSATTLQHTATHCNTLQHTATHL